MNALPLVFTIIIVLALTFKSEAQASADSDQTEKNKVLAQNFYRDLWFSDNTDRYDQYVADEYVVHDIFDRKGVTESGVEQKNIADLFWDNGTLEGAIDYQIAEGDLVATRWTVDYIPSTLFGRIFMGNTEISIINVLRIRDGKIVEFWNHRHDIETPQTLRFTLKGLLFGLAIALIPAIIAIRLRRKLRNIQS